MKRVLTREKQKDRINSLKKRLRESGRTEIDLEALREVQDQFDSLIKDMTSYKALLAGLAIGYDDFSVDITE
jgi:DNA invertase Pin-like site-specific DNA recombinase